MENESNKEKSYNIHKKLVNPRDVNFFKFILMLAELRESIATSPILLFFFTLLKVILLPFAVALLPMDINEELFPSKS